MKRERVPLIVQSIGLLENTKGYMRSRVRDLVSSVRGNKYFEAVSTNKPTANLIAPSSVCAQKGSFHDKKHK